MLLDTEGFTMAKKPKDSNVRDLFAATGTARDIPAAEARKEFGRRIDTLLAHKGWTQADLVERANKFMPAGSPIGRDSVSKYVSGVTFATGPRLDAISKALGVEPEDILPTKGLRMKKSREDREPEGMSAVAPGIARLVIYREVSEDVALKIMNMLHEDKKKLQG